MTIEESRVDGCKANTSSKPQDDDVKNALSISTRLDMDLLWLMPVHACGWLADKQYRSGTGKRDLVSSFSPHGAF